MENEFKEVMSKRTDEELIKIVTTERDDYNPIAVEAAEIELKKRNIDTSKFEEIKQIATVEKKQKEKVDAKVVSSGIRFLNFIIDFFTWLILMIIISFIVGFFIEPTGLGVFQSFYYLLILGSFFGYYAIMEIKFQKTVGKFLTKTKVVNINGEKPETGEIITRTFCRLIPFDRLSFLFVKNGFHDSLSKTKVVKDTTESKNR